VGDVLDGAITNKDDAIVYLSFQNNQNKICFTSITLFNIRRSHIKYYASQLSTPISKALPIKL
jgi:hypothetical protein